MTREEFGVGDIVFFHVAIENGGCVPGIAADARLARFEDEAGDLGSPVGCLPEELTPDEVEAKALQEA